MVSVEVIGRLVRIGVFDVEVGMMVEMRISGVCGGIKMYVVDSDKGRVSVAFNNAVYLLAVASDWLVWERRTVLISRYFLFTPPPSLDKLSFFPQEPLIPGGLSGP